MLALAAACAAAFAACGGSEPASAPVVAAKSRLAALTGTLLPSAASATDGDVADPAAPRVPNDTYASAQALPNPVMLGGYASPDTDRDDIYALTLRAGQTVTLRIADAAADLDLYLYDAGEQVVDAALDPAARARVLTVPADGAYFVAVRAYVGASNYLLSVDGAVSATAGGWRLSDPFIPGEAILRFHEGASEKSAASLRAYARAYGWAAGRAHEIGERNLRIALAALPPAHRAARAIEKGGGGNAKLETLRALKALYHDPEVADAQPNYLYALASPSDPYYGSQWPLPQIDAERAWKVATGHGVVVAVLDSGIVASHPDLAGQLLTGHDFMDGARSGGAFHGTHVAGIVGAAANDIGVIGVAPGARILPVRVCDDATCPAYAIEQGLRFAAGLPNDAGRTPTRIAQVINLSFGREGGASSREQKLFADLYHRGITVIAAAGNENSDARYYPAAYGYVLAVGATDMRRVRAPYSNYGVWVDLVAPGGDPARDRNGDGHADLVLSTSATERNGVVQPGYRYLHGTSVAAPHVSGVVALMKSVAPSLMPADIEALLATGALTDDLGTPGRDDRYGHGLINAHKAVLAARAFAGTAPATAATGEDADRADAAAETAAPAGTAQLGRAYVLLVDPASFATRYATVADVQTDGSYAYRFREVVPGTYLLVAGGDHDNDGRICGPGEPCGAHGTLAAPMLVDVASSDVHLGAVVVGPRARPERTYTR